MNAKEIKTYLNKHTNSLTGVLSLYGFHDFWFSQDEMRCAPPNSDNRTGVSIKLSNELFATNFIAAQPYNGDILGLIQNESGESFSFVMSKIHHYCNLPFSGVIKSSGVDLLENLRKYKKKDIKNHSNKLFDKSILNEFIMIPHINMLNECISPKVLKQFCIGYDPRKDRIIFPHFDWEQPDKIVGITGRTTLSSAEAKALDVPKYWNYIKGYYKTSNLYGYSFAKENIQQREMVVIFESEKSVMKQFTIERTKGFSVSVGGHEISDKQVEFILKNTSPTTEIIIAFDKDIMVSENKLKDGTIQTGKDWIASEAKRFGKYRPASFVYDNFNILGEKDSPIDKGLKVWNHLLKWRIKV